MSRPGAVVFALWLTVGARAYGDGPASVDAAAALKRLGEGNRTFVASGSMCVRQSPARRDQVTAAQHPIAVIVGCSDSRVPPEALFNQGIGDLFVVRVAGNVVDDVALGSIEYAVSHLGASLVVVLGHERCGAVEAALSPAAAEGHVEAIVRRIRPAIERVRNRPGDALDNAIRANIAAQARAVSAADPVLAPLVREGRVRVVGARYDLDSGLVEWLDSGTNTARIK